MLTKHPIAALRFQPTSKATGMQFFMTFAWVSLTALSSLRQACAFFSLVQWRAQRPSTMFTLGSAGITAGLAWGFWGLVEAGIAAVPNTVMFALSLAMLTFLIYNVFAGGNPPKKTTAEDDEQLAAAAAAS
ncbi:hypothetical protein WJX79_008692 [Trebouxia sp. C0005]